MSEAEARTFASPLDAPIVLGALGSGAAAGSMGTPSRPTALLPAAGPTTTPFVVQETIRGLTAQLGLVRGSIVYHIGWYRRLLEDANAEAPLPEDLGPAQAEFDAWMAQRWLPHMSLVDAAVAAARASSARAPEVGARPAPPSVPAFVGPRPDVLPIPARTDVEIEMATAGVSAGFTEGGEEVEGEEHAWPGPIGSAGADAGAEDKSVAGTDAESA